MRRLLFTFLVGVTTVSGAVIVTNAPGQLIAANSKGDYVYWSQFGPDQTQVGQSFSANTVNSDSVNGSVASGSAVIYTAGTDWTVAANSTTIQKNDALLSTDSGNGLGAPLTLSFLPIYGGGTYLQAIGSGQFTARIQAFAG